MTDVQLLKVRQDAILKKSIKCSNEVVVVQIKALQIDELRKERECTDQVVVR